MKLRILLTLDLVVLLSSPALADCNSETAQFVLSYLTTESEVSSYLNTGCSEMMTQFLMPTVIARRNQARLQSESGQGAGQKTVTGYQLQVNRDGSWFAGPTYLSYWECADAQWAPGMIAARCVEVQVRSVE